MDQRNTLGIRNSLLTTFSTFLSLITGFAVHRLLTFSDLSPGKTLSSQDQISFYTIGFFSDFWVAYLFSTLVLIFGLFRIEKGIAISVILFISLLTSLHVLYVEFFKMQLVPFHLQYLTDFDFIRSNGSAAFSFKFVITFLSFIASYLAAEKLFVVLMRYKIRIKTYFAILGLIALFLHNRNIVLKLSWFVPDNLQHNWIESLFIKASHSRIPPALSEDEKKFLKDKLAEKSDSITDIITRKSVKDDEVEIISTKIRDEFNKAKFANRKPMLVIVLLESLRPAETGYFSTEQSSITPNIDKIAHESIVFRNAYSTGSVTRGAQEAVLCTYLGSRETSQMRGNAIAKTLCITDYLRKEQTTHTFWHHGGDGRFDSQLDFWISHGVDDLLSQNDFSEDAPRTNWGVSDKALFAKSTERLSELVSSTDKPAVFGLILTITNHIPWTLPIDASPNLKQKATSFTHPSYATTAYTDEAIGEFKKLLISKNLWDNSIVIFASDHGNNVAPYSKLYPSDLIESHKLQSHINLIVTGGLVSRALVHFDEGAKQRYEFVSQADIGMFSAFILSEESGNYFGDPLFTMHRKTPILSDLEDGLFIPHLNKLIPNHLLVNDNLKTDFLDEYFSIMYFRAYLRYILGQDNTQNSVADEL